MRPSKLRFPERTEQATRSFSRIALETSAGSGPLFPMQVVQPYPTTWKPSCSKYGMRPASLRYSVTTIEPGARLVFTHGRCLRPDSTAFRARRPAPTMTDGFEVFVQLVIAAMTTEPSWSENSCASPCSFVSRTATPAGASATATPPPPTPSDQPAAGALAPPPAPGPFSVSSAFRNRGLLSDSGTRCCGSFGPAIAGSTVERSSSTWSLYSAGGVSASWKRPCARAYASTSAACASARPVKRR